MTDEEDAAAIGRKLKQLAKSAAASPWFWCGLLIGFVAGAVIL